MTFFQRNRDDLARRGIDPARLPPGQYHTDRFPVLHAGETPHIDPHDWRLRLFGRVREEKVLTYDDLRALPRTEVVTDIHCVTKWSKFDTHWEGVLFRDLLDVVELGPAVSHVIQHAAFGYSTNVPLDDLLGDNVLVAWAYEGRPLAPEHGGPVRMMLPRLYFWKSAKWLLGLEFSDVDVPGYWERNGYHNYGDPWLQQRYWGD